jgi:hypothetical protein
MNIEPNITRDRVKKILTAIAAAVSALAIAHASGHLPMPASWVPAFDKAVGFVTGAGIWLGILGASPLGRLVWTGDGPVPPAPVETNSTPSKADITVTQKLTKPSGDAQ